MTLAGGWCPWQVAGGHVGHRAEQTQLDADPEPWHLVWLGFSVHVLFLRFLPEEFGDTRSRGDRGVSAKAEMHSSACPNPLVPESGSDAFIDICLLFIDEASLAQGLLRGASALCTVFH